MSEELLAAFAAESSEILDGLEESIRELQTGRADSLDQLFRLVHTLKGSAGIVGLARLETFAHEWESRLGKLRTGAFVYRKSCQGSLLSCRDHVGRLLQESSPEIGAESGQDGSLRPEDLAVLESLDASLRPRAGESVPGEGEAPGNAGEAPPSEAAPPGSASGTASSGEVLVERRNRSPSASHDHGYARVANAKLEAILAESSELAQSISELGRELKETGDGGLLDRVQALHSRASTLYRDILETRTIPFGEVAERYRRAVAEIGHESGKELRFELGGADTEIDKTLADRLMEPLLHLVRNAADHGIEKPEERQAAGKPREGVVALRARREAGTLVVRVEDDGSGVDPEDIRICARKAGFGKEGLDLDSLGEEELLAFLFRPGFSLSENVTKWSGRGVGLDAVERSVRSFRGTVRLETRPGHGFASEIRLPLALSLVEGFTARAGDTQLLIPFEAVRSCVSFDDDGLSAAVSRTLPIRGRLLPTLDLGLLYGAQAKAAPRIVAVVESGGFEAGLVLDEVGEALSVAVRPVDRRFADSPGVAGVAALGDGNMVLVLDAAELVRLALAGQ